MKTFLTALLILTSSTLAFAKGDVVECKAQLARSSSAYTELEPKGQGYDKLKLDKNGVAKTSYTFDLDGKVKTVYRADLTLRTRPSNWNKDAIAFTVDVNLYDVTNNKLVLSNTETSDNVRTRFLLSQLLEEDTSIVAFDSPSLELRNSLLTSEDEKVKSLANEGRWHESNVEALSQALVNPEAADFLSLHCFLKN